MAEKKTKTGGLKKWVVGAAMTAVVTGATAFTLPYVIGEKVVRVIDGDTFEIANEQRIRLFGINAPELEYCDGKEAKEALTKLILNKRVILRDPEMDSFRRIMALVYVKDKLINAEMLRIGMATHLGSAKPETKDLRTATDYARENKVGIFGTKCVSETPPNAKCIIKGNRDPNEGWRQFYYLPDCRNYIQVKILFYEGDRWFCSEAEAKAAGFVKAAVCK